MADPTPSTGTPSAEADPEAQALRAALLERYLRSTVHRLNNDLVVIGGFADLLAHGERDERRRQQLDQIASKGREATRLLALYAALADRGSSEPRPGDLAGLVREAALLLGPTIVHEAQATLEERVARDLPAVRVDRPRLLQWIAAAAAALLPETEGGGERRTRGTRLRLAALLTGGAVRLRLTAVLPARVESAERVAIARALDEALASAAEMARAFGAAAGARWRSGRVCVLTLDLDPLGRVPPASGPRPAGRSDAGPGEAAAAPRVLVCVRETMLGELVRDVLDDGGHAARLAPTPADAARALEAEPWDLVLVDGAFGADEHALARRARAAGASLGWLREGDVGEAREPAAPWLSKPFRPAELLAFVARLRTARS